MKRNMDDDEQSLIKTIKKILTLANEVLNDNYIVSDNDKMWLQTVVSQKIEERVNLPVLYGVPTETKPFGHMKSFNIEEMNCIQNFITNIIANDPSDMKHFAKMVKTKIEEYLELSGEKIQESLAENKNVFIIHGHGTELIEKVKKYIRSLGLNPVILGEEMCVAKPIIEYLKEYLDKNKVVHAVSLLTFDEFGYIKSQPDEKRPRARINANAETLMAIKELGNENVTIIVEEGLDLSKDFSDLQGIYYVRYNNDDDAYWKEKLKKSFKRGNLI